MKGLLLIERAILEAVETIPRKENDLSIYLGVKVELVRGAIRNLINDKLIIYTTEGYQANCSSEAGKRISEVNSKNSKKEEELDVVQNMENFKVVKMYLSSFEEKIFEMHMKNLSDFVNSIDIGMKMESTEQGKVSLKNKKVFGFGYIEYDKLIQKSLSL